MFWKVGRQEMFQSRRIRQCFGRLVGGENNPNLLFLGRDLNVYCRIMKV